MKGNCTCRGFTECMPHCDAARGGRHGDVGLQIDRQTMQPVFDFVHRAAGKPFLLWCAPMMPHNPPARLLDKYSKLPSAQGIYMAMIEWFDETIGQLAAYIDKKGLSESTLFVYAADNGWVQLEGQQPLYASRAKISPYDAGIRTPVFFRWKGKIKPYRDDKTLVSSLDIAPTILSAAGRKPPANWPGIDVRDTKKLANRRTLFGASFMHTSIDIAKPAANLKYRWAIRDNWKLILPFEPNLSHPIWEGRPETAWGIALELYDLAVDPDEKQNLAVQGRDLVESLTSAIDGWWMVGPVVKFPR